MTPTGRPRPLAQKVSPTGRPRLTDATPTIELRRALARSGAPSPPGGGGRGRSFIEKRRRTSAPLSAWRRFAPNRTFRPPYRAGCLQGRRSCLRCSATCRFPLRIPDPYTPRATSSVYLESSPSGRRLAQGSPPPRGPKG